MSQRRYNGKVPIPPADLPPYLREPPPIVDVGRRIVEPPSSLAESPETVLISRPNVSAADLYAAREEAAWNAWTTIAIAEITLLAAEVRERGAANFPEVLERVDQAARGIEAISFEVARSAQNAKEIVRHLQLEVGPSMAILPELREEYQRQVEVMNRRVAILKKKAEAYYPVLSAYRDALEILVAVRDDSTLDSCFAATFDRGEDGGDV